MLVLYQQQFAESFATQQWVGRKGINLKMGLGDMLQKAFANDPNMPPVKHAGLTQAKEPVEVEFLPSHSKAKAY